MNDENKILSMIGLATKAGKTVSGITACRYAVSKKKPSLVLVAEDASKNTLSAAIKMCSINNTGYVLFSTKEKLGHFTGKTDRAVLAIIDEGFSAKIRGMIENFDENNK